MRVKSLQRVVMDLIKMEHEIDPLAIHTSDNTDVEEKKPLSEEVNVLNLHTTQIKKECGDRTDDRDLITQIKIEEFPVPITVPMATSEAEEEWRDWHTAKDELKLEVSAEENEVLTDTFRAGNPTRP
ncbi:uncharacterized protein [Periplaneta americana]|uniref:uncharacterized protein isoform X11 n=1 Tax=Periplaneta americana TaxID=6978 RepID=UPI0037E8FD88